MSRFLWILCLTALLGAGTGHGHETLDAGGDGAGTIGFEEKTGGAVSPELAFRDERGAQVNLGEIFGKPVILTLVYYSCEHICPLLLGGLSQALPRLTVAAGRDYRVVTLSFDETDDPQMARSVKKNYVKAAGSAFPEEGWKFLTGDRDAIAQLTRSVGFTFRKEIHGFSHPVALIFLSPEGKITKYLQVTNYQYGAEFPITFSSFDLTVALTEAAQGRAVTGLRKALLYCFAHEPPGQSRFFTFIAAVGLLTLAAMGGFFVYLRISTRRYRKGSEYDREG